MFNVLHIASGDLWAGAEVQLYNLVVELNKQADLKLLVILLNHGALEVKLQEKGVVVQVIDESRINAFSIVRELISIMREFHPDVVHTHRLKENILGSVAAKFGSSAISVRTVHGQGESTVNLWNIYKCAYGIIDQFCGRWLQDRVITVSKPLAQLLAHNFPADNIVTIENGINIDELNSKSRESLSEPLPGKLNSIKVCIVCRLTPVKRLDVFLKVAKAVLDISPEDYDFYIFGDGPLRDEVNSEILECGLVSCVHMMGFQENIPSCLGQMDILLITSDHEGLPMNLLESMALGVFVIAHSTGGITSVLGDGAYGCALDSQDVDGFVNSVLAFKEENEDRRKIKALSQNMVISQYSSDVCAEKYLRLYAELSS